MLRVALVLAGNWLAHYVHYQIFADSSPYMFSLFVDFLSAVVILSRPAGRMQALIGWTLLTQIMIHSGYWVNILSSGYSLYAEYRYWAWLDWIALGQIALLGAWTIDGMARHIFGDSYRQLVPWYRRVPRPQDPAGVVQS